MIQTGGSKQIILSNVTIILAVGLRISLKNFQILSVVKNGYLKILNFNK